jgi:hypothetical protein
MDYLKSPGFFNGFFVKYKHGGPAKSNFIFQFDSNN